MQQERRLSAEPVPGYCRHARLPVKEDGLLFQDLPRRFAEAVPPARILLGWHRLPSCAWQLPVGSEKEERERPGQRDVGAKGSPLRLSSLFWQETGGGAGGDSAIVPVPEL